MILSPESNYTESQVTWELFQANKKINSTSAISPLGRRSNTCKLIWKNNTITDTLNMMRLLISRPCPKLTRG
jgi:hypothetical protein